MSGFYWGLLLLFVVICCWGFFCFVLYIVICCCFLIDAKSLGINTIDLEDHLFSHLSLFSSLSLFHVFLSCPVSPCWHSRNITNLGSPEPYNRDFRLDTGERAHLQSISWEIEAEELKTSSGNQCRLHSVTPLKQHKRNTQRRLLKHKI